MKVHTVLILSFWNTFCRQLPEMINAKCANLHKTYMFLYIICSRIHDRKLCLGKEICTIIKGLTNTKMWVIEHISCLLIESNNSSHQAYISATHSHYWTLSALKKRHWKRTDSSMAARSCTKYCSVISVRCHFQLTGKDCSGTICEAAVNSKSNLVVTDRLCMLMPWFNTLFSVIS